MAKVRAYKLAEELSIDRDDFVKRAAEVGVELRSAMVGLEDEQVELLRRRLGGVDTENVVEKRVAGGVIRRRKKAPAPEPVLVEEPAADAVAEVEPKPDPAPLEESEPAVAIAAELVADPEAPTQPEPEPEAEPLAAEAVKPAQEPVESEVRAAPMRPGEPARPVRRPVRRQAVETANLREQETLARQMRGNIRMQMERRRRLVEQQSRIQSRRRRPVGGGRRPLPARDRKQNILKLGGPAPFQELAGQLGLKVSELMRRARALGAEVERDQLVDLETAELLATELGFEFQRTATDLEQELAGARESDDEGLVPRAPIVTVMGHIDHGKTSLLDTLRNTQVTEGEAGGITQHIGAYRVEAPGGTITFLDTPGHAAFTQMRARGAQATDIVVLVVAADDGVMPQTVEAIAHARAAGVPLVVAINKMDRPDANPNRVRQGLLEHELVPEELGGDTICVEISATKGTGLDRLLEMINLQAELLELRARDTGPARGIVIEARLEKGRGVVATLLIQEGELVVGDAVVAGTTHGRVRLLVDEHGDRIERASPATPVHLIGLQSVPEAGDELIGVANEREAKALAEYRIAERRRAATADRPEPIDAEQLFAQLDETDLKELFVVLKADVRGTMEATRDALQQLSTDRVNLQVLHAGVGGITESDVMLASASNAQVIGFHVRPEAAAVKAAERESVEIRTADVVYELIDNVRAVMEGLLPPKQLEHVTGHAEVRQIFTIPRVGTIAGCLVTDGPVRRSDLLRIVRDGVSIYSSRVGSLRRVKDDVREVVAGLECGIGIENYNDVKVGDVLEAYVIEETPDTL
jgi:translation initiation factor IF-2